MVASVDVSEARKTKSLCFLQAGSPGFRRSIAASVAVLRKLHKPYSLWAVYPIKSDLRSTFL